MAPSHYDPLEGMNRKSFPMHHRTHGPGSGLIPVITADKFPKGCVRAIQFFERCSMVNGDVKCQNEKEDILNVCPRWSIEEMARKKKFILKVTGLKNRHYRKALEVSPYNKGRDVSELEDKTWLHGTREFLRPDTMWADDRYASITQKEINEAKERNAARKAGQKEHHEHKEHKHYDWIEAKRREEAPLYP